MDNTYERSLTPKEGEVFSLWVYDEEAFEEACQLYEDYRAHPEDPQFQVLSPPPVPEDPQEELKIDGEGRILRVVVRKTKSPLSYGLTYFFLLVCVGLFLWNEFQEASVLETKGSLALEVGLTPLQQTLLFDYPNAMEALSSVIAKDAIPSMEALKEMPLSVQAEFKQAESIPYWKGVVPLISQRYKTGGFPQVSAPLFEQIRQGQVWRIFTPCLLHRDFLHILFNMGWLWLLGKQIEERIKRGRMLLLFLVIGSVANITQYLVSGPYFLGFSGIVVGMAGFIWSRQKIAPWEGYPLQKMTLLFILCFVLAMFGLELVIFGLQLFGWIEASANIANTAHLVGGVVGILLGRIRFFAKRVV